MGQRRYPPLTPSEVQAILIRSGFTLKNQEGSHASFERLPDETDKQRRVVQVDMAVKDFDDYLIKSMIRQSGMNRERFYGATKRTAQKACVPFLKLQQAPELEGE